MKNNIAIAIVMVLLGTGGGFLYLHTNRAPEVEDAALPGQCAKHQIAEAQCPWCNKALVQEMGPCPEHGVPEALCSRCNAALIAGFKAEADWCAGHQVPESQCVPCGQGTGECK